MSRRWITLIFALAFVFVLGGCGNKATNSDESNRHKIIYGSVVKAYLKTIHDGAASDQAQRSDIMRRDFPNSVHKDSALLKFWTDQANVLLNYVNGIELIEVKSVTQKGDNNIEVVTREKWQIKGKDIITESIYTFTKQSVDWRIYEVKSDNLYKVLADLASDIVQKKTVDSNGATNVKKVSQKTSDENELDGLVFTDFRAEKSSQYKTYDVYFFIANNGDRVQHIYQSDFVIKREGENVIKPYRAQSAFPDKQGIWSYNDMELYPGDRTKALLLYYVNVFPSEYTLYYMHLGKMIPIYRFQ